MSLVATDWEITRSTGNIRYVGADHDGTIGDNGSTTPSYSTVIDFHRWLQGLADDAVASGDDELDITNTNPSSRSTDNIITLINGYNIDDTASEHLYDGSIIQNDSDDIYDGIVNFGNTDVQIQIIQNGAVLTDDWWNYDSAGLNADSTSGISHRFMIKTVDSGTAVDNRKLIGTCRRFGYSYSEFTINATARGNNVLALTDSSDLNNTSDESTVSGWSSDYSNTEGYATIDVDNDSDTDGEDHYYSTWDLDTGTHSSINDFYEYSKYLTRDGSSSTLYGISGELFRGITHQVNLNTGGTNSGTFSAYEQVSWGTGNTGQMLAINNTTASSAETMWIQLLTGSAPGVSTLITGATSGATATTTASSATSEKTISKPFCGASTGSALIGAYGLGIVAADLSSSDQLTDLEGNLQQPPNNVTNTVSGLVHGEDRVLVAPYDGSTSDTNGDPAIYKTQLTLDTGSYPLQTSSETEVHLTASIPSDTPSSGTIRVVSDTGFETRVVYTSYSGTTFTISSTDFSDADAQATSSNNVYISYIDTLATGSTVSAGSFETDTQYVIKTVGTTDFTAIGADSNTVGEIFTATGAGSGTGDAYTYSASASFTSVQNSTRNLIVLVRDGGDTPIKQYISVWTQTSSNSSTTVIRTSDT